jgi:hypothetical protein
MALNEERRIKALTRLALATREKVEPATYVLYVEDTAGFSTDVLEKACRRLETALTWFPKVSELVSECRIVARYEAEQRAQQQRPQIQGKPVTPDQIAALRDRVAVEVQRKRMRS